MKRITHLIVALAMLLTGSHAFSSGNRLDLQKVSDSARQNQSIIVLVFGSQECGYCNRLEREIITPLCNDPEINDQIIVRHFDINKGGKLRDFDGQLVRYKLFIDRYRVFATPTLIIVDADGNPLLKPIVGYNSRDKYSVMLDEAMHEAFAAVQTVEPTEAVAVTR